MSTNDKQTAPERTAMQQAIDIQKYMIRNLYQDRQSHLNVGNIDAVNRIDEDLSIHKGVLKDLIILKEVEKEQLIDAAGGLFFNKKKEFCSAEEWYNEKYPNHGK